MVIAKGRPESGFRVALERDGEAYAGMLETRDATFDVRVEGEVVLGCPPELEEKVRLLVRAALKHAEHDARPPPARITRWRP